MTTKTFTKEDYSLVDDDWIAEFQSLQPERTIRLPRTSTSWDALCVLYLVSHLESQFWITDEAHRKVANQAYVGNYEGEWGTVQEILERYPRTPKEFYDIFTEYHSPEEFFGNLVPRARRLSLGMNSILRDPHGPVRKVQRHRGYRDKGTLRPAHQPPVIPPYGEQKTDRRKKIGHPLVRDGTDESNTGEDHLPDTHF